MSCMFVCQQTAISQQREGTAGGACKGSMQASRHTCSSFFGSESRRLFFSRKFRSPESRQLFFSRKFRSSESRQLFFS